MPGKDQIFIYTDEQISLIKKVFSDNHELLHLIRNIFLQFPLTDAEWKSVRSQVNDEVFNLLKIRILPDLSPTFPLGQQASILSTLTQDLKTKDVDQMALQFEAKQLEIDYLNQCFEELRGNTPLNRILLSDLGSITGKTPEDNYIDMTAYLFILGYVDPMLGMIRSIAGQKDETVDQAKERMRRDSAK